MFSKDFSEENKNKMSKNNEEINIYRRQAKNQNHRNYIPNNIDDQNQNSEHVILEFKDKINIPKAQERPNDIIINNCAYDKNCDSHNIGDNKNVQKGKLKTKETKKIQSDPLADDNKSEIDMINNSLFAQLSKINITLFDLDEKISKEKFNSKGKVLPKIDTIEISLLNQSVYLSKLKEYGYGIYVFFLYLLNLIFTFGILLIFAFYYIYYIFYKYYDELEDKEEYLLFEDYNLISIVSGVQIIKFRKYYMNKFGKVDFLEKYKNFDVI